jgi:hypothetical protein
MKYRFVIASEIGTSHLKNQTQRQDCARCFQISGGQSTLVSVVCDGAGSAKYGRDGAIIICKSITSSIKEYFKTEKQLPTEEQVWIWVDQVRDLIAKESEMRSCNRRDFSSTLVLLIITKNEILTAHIGDGAIVGRSTEEGWVTLSESENGEYASTTYFITEDPSPRLRIKLIKNTYTAFSLFSDGIEDIALIQSTKSPHVPFFEKMIASIDRGEGEGNLHELSNSLSVFLNSEKVCEKTDDDKSLILISTK